MPPRSKSTDNINQRRSHGWGSYAVPLMLPLRFSMQNIDRTELVMHSTNTSFREE